LLQFGLFFVFLLFFVLRLEPIIERVAAQLRHNSSVSDMLPLHVLLCCHFVISAAKCIMERVAAKLGHDSFTWRTVPTNNRSLGKSAVAVEPIVEQWFLSSRGIKEGLDTEQQVGS
jgi:glutamate synthase domain-containing protein 1